MGNKASSNPNVNKFMKYVMDDKLDKSIQKYKEGIDLNELYYGTPIIHWICLMSYKYSNDKYNDFLKNISFREVNKYLISNFIQVYLIVNNDSKFKLKYNIDTKKNNIHYLNLTGLTIEVFKHNMYKNIEDCTYVKLESKDCYEHLNNIKYNLSSFTEKLMTETADSSSSMKIPKYKQISAISNEKLYPSKTKEGGGGGSAIVKERATPCVPPPLPPTYEIPFALPVEPYKLTKKE